MISQLRILLVVFLIFSGSFSSIADSPFLTIERYSSVDGLSNNAISCIFKDSKGFLWIGTNDGLNKFDGRKFQIFKHSATDTNSLPGNIIYRISEDKNGNIWVSTMQGICSYNSLTHKITRLTPISGQSATQYLKRYLLVDSKNRLWYNDENGMVCYSQSKATFETFKLEKIGVTTEIFQIYEDKKGEIWIVTIDGIFRVDNQNKIFALFERNREKTRPGFIPRCMIQLNNMNYYTGLWAHGIAEFNLTSNAFIEKSPDYTIWTIEDGVKENTILSGGTSSGVYEFNTDSYSMTHFELYNFNTKRFEESLIHYIYKDNTGTIWFGSDDGLLKMIPSLPIVNLIDYKLLGIIPSTEKPSEIFYDPLDKNILWFFLWTRGIFKFNLITNEFTKYAFDAQEQKLKLPNKFINMLRADKKGNIWAGISGNGLYRYDRKSNSFIDAYVGGNKSQMINSATFSLNEQLADTLCFVSGHRGFYKFVPETGYYSEYDSKISGTSNDITSFIFDITFTSTGNAYLPSSDNGMYFYDRALNKFSQFKQDHKQNLYPTIYSRDITSDASGNIWVASAEGLIKINSENIIERIYTANEGAPSNLLRSVSTDSKGTFWITSDKGLINFIPDKEEFILYDQTSGLINSSDIMLSILSDGKMALGYYDKISIIDPSQLIVRNPLHTLVLNSIKILNQDVPLNTDMRYTIQPNQNLLSLSFSLLDFDSKLPIFYEFMLEGLHSDWISLGNSSEITFTHLAPGSYKLKARARNSGSSEWSLLDEPVQLTVLPPFYTTWWFYSLVLILVVVVIYVLVRFRIQKIRKQEQQKSIISKQLLDLELKALRAQMNPHFIFNSLNSIQAFILKENKIEASDYLQKFSKLIRLILDNSQKTSNTISDETEILGLYLELEQLRLKNKFDFEITVGEGIDESAIEIPSMVIQPLVENSIWHGFTDNNIKGYLRVGFNLEGNTLICTIEDNGVGRLASHQKKLKLTNGHVSKGMQMTEERLKTWSRNFNRNYNFTIIDHPENGRGTKIIISLEL